MTATHSVPGIAQFVVRCWQAYPSLRQEAQSGALNPLPRSILRRLSPLAKIVLQTIAPCIQAGEQLPAVFSTSHGEIGQSLNMLQELQNGEEISPTAFSLSVHNAIAGLFSIAYGNQQEISVVASASGGIVPGFLESLGLLREGHAEVLLVFYDESLPAFYPTSPYQMTQPHPEALTLKLAATGEGLAVQLSRLRSTRHDGEQPLQLTALIRFLQSEQKLLQLGEQNHCWQWQKT